MDWNGVKTVAELLELNFGREEFLMLSELEADTCLLYTSVLARTDARRVVHLLNCMQGDHYIRISEGNLSLRKFCVGGWPTRTYDPGQEAI